MVSKGRAWRRTTLQLSLRIKYHLQERQKEGSILQANQTISCVLRAQKIHLPSSANHEELNSEAQVKEAALPRAAVSTLILLPRERQHKAAFTGAQVSIPAISPPPLNASSSQQLLQLNPGLAWLAGGDHQNSRISYEFEAEDGKFSGDIFQEMASPQKQKSWEGRAFPPVQMHTRKETWVVSSPHPQVRNKRVLWSFSGPPEQVLQEMAPS